jgi:membrane protein YqaA with SNARE-associated domain
VIFRPLRRLYHWVLGWAGRPAASWALFAIAFAESSFFPIPPDILLIALALGKPDFALRFAGICTVGSVLGGIAGYGLGLLLSGVAHDMLLWFTSPEVIESVRQKFEENTFMAIAIAGFTPIPYKVFTLAAGIFGVPFGTFVLASVLSRGTRFYLEAVILRRFGEPAKQFLEKRFELITILGGILLVGGFLAIEYLF